VDSAVEFGETLKYQRTLGMLTELATACARPEALPPQDWGNSLPLLHEIRHALQRLIETGAPSAIDLRALPFGPGDEAQLLATLGQGEVTIAIEALGPTRIWETAFAGVWVVEHCNTEGARIALWIEVTRVPEILLSQPGDLDRALITLDQTLAASPAEPSGRPQSL
jgi:hydrogenase-1 operon protein HyaF